MAIKDFEMNIKNADGSYDILHPVTKVDNVLGLYEKIFVESGQNANGDYLKIGDGTMICRRTIDRATTVPPNTINRLNWVFPAAFTIIPTVLVTPVLDTTTVRVGAFQATGDSVYQSQVAVYHDFNQSLLIGLRLLAIGRWK
ncbi:hypothetical protein FYJ27_05420 [Anaerosalibacter bizertensis]|uniref:H-type lectin domain-containing protein n=1 Tax=Anaerosalibacter bizertensis TaxID=932217 RepID=A0A844FGU5_9FIRM|nr:hypothetical protein [Anaerosalibacter bizertensis]MSS43171.1 hypothetical protein [Anaerosalibacter bizertensis]